jgi:alkylation response protein AidB-like acyl-CoA dehydrogenase
MTGPLMHPAEMELMDTEIEESLRDTVRELLADRCPTDRVLAAYDGDRSLTADLWKPIAAELGLAGLLVPEELGGAGASAREAAVALEELGRAVAPVPFLTSAVLATSALAGDTRTDAGTTLLRALAGGERTAALVVPLSAAPWSPATVEVHDGTLTGWVTSVAGAVEADVLLVPTRDGALHAIPAGAVALEPVVSLDETRPLADVDLTGVSGQVVVVEVELPRVLGLGAALLASEQVGVAQWCLDTTVGYLKERRQFGRVVGGFQALKHRLADLYVDLESARAAAHHAAAAVAVEDPDAEVATSVAQAYCSLAAVRAAEECVQLHGGIAMTWEHPAHLYLKRAKADQLALGSPGAHRRRLAALVGLDDA